MNDLKSEYLDITKQSIAKFREKLLDLTNRNNFLNLSFNARSNRNIRIIDELPNVIYERLLNEGKFKLISLPNPKDEKDENSEEFLSKFEYEKLNNANYLKSIEELGDNFDESNEESRKAIRKLKDEVRELVGLKKRIAPDTVSIEEYARSHNIIPNYEVPNIKVSEDTENKYIDTDLQTLFYDLDLQRKCRLLNREYQKLIDEKGTNTLYISFGCLEWYEAKDSSKKRYAPILLLPITLEANKSATGKKYTISATESELIVNLTLSQKLEKEFDITLPDLGEEDTPEDYFNKLLNDLLAKKTTWKLRRFINITIHTYSKLSMYDDLSPKKWGENGYELGAQKNIIDLFTGSEAKDGDVSDYDLDDKMIIKKVPVLIDNADSSQYSTIIDALEGRNIVIQGPPGTGKSTTIANLIASLMHKKKKILFMAEKKAALDVVYKKLVDKNLDKFVFKLGATTDKKSQFINELIKRVDCDKERFDQRELARTEKEYFDQIKTIGEYRKFLNTKYYDVNEKGFDILSNYTVANLKTRDLDERLDELIPLRNAEKINSKKLYEIYGGLEEITNLHKNIIGNKGSLEHSQWYGLHLHDYNQFEIENFIKIINQIETNAKSQISKIDEFNSLCEAKIDYNITDDNNFNALINIDEINLKNKFIKNIKTEDQIEKLNIFFKYIKEYLSFKDASAKISKIFDMDEDISLKKISKYIRFIQNSHFLSFLFDSNYKEAKTFYKSIKLDGRYTKTDAIENLNQLKIYFKFSNKIEKIISNIQELDELRSIFKDSFKGEKTKISLIEDLINSITSEKLTKPDIIFLIKNHNNINSLSKIVENLIKLRTTIKDYFSKIMNVVDIKKFFLTEDNLKKILNKIQNTDFNDKQGIENIIKYNYCLSYSDKKVISFLNHYLEKYSSLDYSAEIYKYIFYKTLAQKLFAEEKLLSKFNMTNFDNEIIKFNKLDREINEIKSLKLINTLLGINITQGVSRGKVSDLTEMSLIEREMDKQRAHIPYRQLLKRAPTAITELKPCFMLSPISLSQITEPKPEMFDVLIIDEASQMRIEDSLGAMLRASQIIIVGDPEQLPPSSYFDSKTKFEGDGLVDDDESILDLAISKYKPVRLLKWHYRSNHESLINFSNYHFYNNQLIIPPSPNDKFAINHHYTKGIYQAREKEKKNNNSDAFGSSGTGGTNQIECEKICKGVIEHMENNFEKSCLVVTMNDAQRILIDEQLILFARNNTVVDDYISYWKDTMEPFAVKNLENVQGDERDFIFVSTLYGPNKDNVVMQRFGPINSPKGHRRLNVLFTRAKDGIELYTSLNSEDIKGTETSERGRAIFKNYIEYARDKKLDIGINSNRDSGSPFQDEVASMLEERGYEITQEIGVAGFFIDIGVKHKDYPHGYLAGIETDGASYHSSLCARDNDIVKQQVLENYGWNIYRIWSTDWWKNTDHEMQRLLTYLNGILISVNKENKM